MKRMHGFTLVLSALWSALFFVGTFEAQTNGTASPLAIDVTASHSRSFEAKNIATRAFSTTQPNELLLAFVDSDSSNSTTTQVNSVAGAGLTWELVARANAQLGDAEIWRAFAPTPLTNVTVTATLQQPAGASISVVAFTGADTSGTNGSGAIGATGTFSADPGAPTGSVQTTRAGSWVFGVGNDWDSAIARTLGPNQVMVHQYLATINNTYWVQRQSAPTGAPGATVVINDTAPKRDRYDLALVEVLPATGGVATNKDFSLSASPSSQSIAVGRNTSYTATLTPQNGYSTAVNLSVSGLPSGATGTFNPAILNGTGNSQLNITTDGNVAAGTYPLVITATDGVLTHTADISLVVSAAPDFTMSINPPSQSVQAGANTTYGITITGANGFSAATNLAVSGLPAGATGAFNPANVNGSGASQLTVSTTTNVAPGSYPFIITATSGSLSHTANATLVVNGSGSTQFAIDSVSSGDVSSPSTTASTGVFSTTQNNELLLAFVSAGSAQNSISGVAGGGLTWELVNRANTQPGDAEVWRAFAPSPLSNVSVSATLAQSAAWSITVVAFTGADTSGTNGSGAVGANAIFGAASGAPAGSLQTTRAGSWVFGVGTDGSTAATITADANQTVVHQYPSTVNNTYWVQRQNSPTPAAGTTVSIDDTAPAADSYDLLLVEVLPAAAQGANPDFTVSASPASQTIAVGASTTYTATITPQNGYSAAVNLSVTGLPAGATAAFNPAALNGSGNSQLSIATDGTVATGTYPFTITATDGTLTHSANVNLVVSAAPDFTLALSPASQSVQAGANATYGITIAGQNGYSAAANLTVSGLPNGATGAFNPATVNGSGTSQLIVSAGAAVAPGTYALTVAASSGSLTHTASGTLVVTAPADFTIAATPASQTILAGGNTTFTVSITALNGYAAATTFGVVGLPAGATGAFSPTSISGSGSSQLTVTTTSATAAGTYPLTITATGGGISHSAGVSLVVSAAVQHSVTVSWTDGDSGISGYNVYRATGSPGTYTKINSSPVTTTSYTDASVLSGTTYYYVVTAVDTSGVESAFSSPAAQAQIPSP